MLQTLYNFMYLQMIQVYSNTISDQLEETVNSELLNISDWLTANKLTLNTSKSNFMIIKPRQQNLSKYVKFTINNEVLHESECVKYLGVLMDKGLTWKEHIQYINTKLAKNIGILAKLRHFTPRDTLCSIYSAVILPYVSYCTSTWGGASATVLDPLSKSPKKATRVIFLETQIAPPRPLLQKFKSHTIEDTYNLECAKFMFDISKGCCENFFGNYFKLSKHRHKIQTRQATSGKFSFTRTRTKHKLNFITTSGVKIWTNFPIDTRNSPTKKLFGKCYKQILLDKY